MMNRANVYNGSFRLGEFGEGTYGTFFAEDDKFSAIMMGTPVVGRYRFEKEQKCGTFYLDQIMCNFDNDKEGIFFLDIDDQPYKWTFSFSYDPETKKGKGKFAAKSLLLESMEDSWRMALSKEIVKEYFMKLQDILAAERKSEEYAVYPPEDLVFQWTKTRKIDQVKVVILGQDPYHGPGQADGLAFSVSSESVQPRQFPTSLKNILKELKREIPDFVIPSNGNLWNWATQGVLLLNTCLTVREGEPESHKEIGWNKFTDAVISYLSENKFGLVFILWGKEAKEKKKIIDTSKHFILKGGHPSGLSANRKKGGFFSSAVANSPVPKYFLKCNEILRAFGEDGIDWCSLR